MAKLKAEVSDGSGSVAAATEFMEDSLQKYGKHLDTFKRHMANQAEVISELQAENEKIKTDDARELASVTSTLTRERDDLQKRLNIIDDKARRAQAALAS